MLDYIRITCAVPAAQLGDTEQNTRHVYAPTQIYALVRRAFRDDFDADATGRLWLSEVKNSNIKPGSNADPGFYHSIIG